MQQKFTIASMRKAIQDQFNKAAKAKLGSLVPGTIVMFDPSDPSEAEWSEEGEPASYEIGVVQGHVQENGTKLTLILIESLWSDVVRRALGVIRIHSDAHVAVLVSRKDELNGDSNVQ